MPNTARSYAVSSLGSPGKTVLRIGGTTVASVERYSGGEPFAEVVTEPGGLLPYSKKHIGGLHFADLEAQVALDAHPTLFRWIRDAWFGNPDREKVALEAQAEGVECALARLHEVTLPALDQTSRDRRFLTLRIAPRGVRRTTPSQAPEAREEREFLAHNFALKIDGVDCSGVMSIDSFTVRTSLPEEGSKRKAQLVFPDLHLFVDVRTADPFREWFEDFVIAGNNDDDREREGSIIYRIAELAPPEKGPRQVRVDLYCERMELNSTAKAAAGDTQDVPPVRA